MSRLGLVGLVVGVLGSSGCVFFVDTKGCKTDADCPGAVCDTASGFCTPHSSSSSGSGSGSASGSSSSTGSSSSGAGSSGSAGSTSSSGSTGLGTSSGTSASGPLDFEIVHVVAGDRVGGRRDGNLKPLDGLATVQLPRSIAMVPGSSSDFYFIDDTCIRIATAGQHTRTLTCSTRDGGVPLSADGGDLDGPFAAAAFANPTWLIVDPTGNLLVWDDNGLRRINAPTGNGPTVETLVHFGPLSDGGYLQLGPGVTKPNTTQVLALNGNEIDLVIPDGGLSLYAGGATAGYQNASGPASALFDTPTALTVDPTTGTVYVLDQHASVVRTISGLMVSTAFTVDAGAWPSMAFGAGKLYFYGGQIPGADPSLITVDTQGVPTGAPVPSVLAPWGSALAVNDQGQAFVGAKYRVLGSDDGGEFHGVAGDGMNGIQDGVYPGSDSHAEFQSIEGLAINANGDVLVSDSSDLGTFNLAGTSVHTLDAGDAPVNGQVSVDDDHLSFVVARYTFAWRVSRVSGGVVSDLIPPLNGSATSDPGDGNVWDGGAKLGAVGAVVSDKMGGYYLTESLNNRLRHFDPTTGLLTTLAGDGDAGFQDGTGFQTEFNRPQGLATQDGRFVYIADSYNGAIRLFDRLTSNVSTFAVSPLWPDGGNSAALFNTQSLAFGPDGLLYSSNSSTLSRIYGDGGVETFFVNHNVEDGSPINSPQPRLLSSYGIGPIAFGADGGLYFGNETEVRELTGP